MMYIYGKKDPFTYYRDLAICRESEHLVIMHDKGHNMPRFIGDDLTKFSQFLNNAYEEVFFKPMTFLYAVNSFYKKKFVKELASYFAKPSFSKI